MLACFQLVEWDCCCTEELHRRTPGTAHHRTDRHVAVVLWSAVADVRWCGSSVQQYKQSEEKRSDKKERKGQNEIPELPDSCLSKTSNSCFLLIYLQQEEMEKKRVTERQTESRCVVQILVSFVFWYTVNSSNSVPHISKLHIIQHPCMTQTDNS